MAILDRSKPRFNVIELGSRDDVFRLRRQYLGNLLLRSLYAVWGLRMGFKGLRNCARLLLLLRLHFFEERNKGLRIIAGLVHILNAEIIGLGLEASRE